MNFLPVTAVKFVPNSNFILSASGNELSLHRFSDKTFINRVTFEHVKTIHGVKISGSIIIVFGGFSFDICQLIDDKLIPLYLSTKLNDFILDCYITEFQVSLVRFCVSLAHGGVHFFEISTVTNTIKIIGVSKPQEKTLLYCCHLFGSDTDKRHIYLAGGSVMNTIMIWKHTFTDKFEVNTISVLKGYKGAIFNINVNLYDGLMVTVGDDRSVLLWRAENGSTDMSAWKLVRSMFGHESRVWGGVSVRGEDMIITWGEDCSVRVWNKAGVMRAWTTPHQGRSVWAGDIKIADDRIILATGGNDGALVVSEISKNHENTVEQICQMPQTKDFPRQILFVTRDTLLVITDQGNMCAVTDGENGVILSCVSSDINPSLMERYSVAYVHPSHPLVILGNMSGQLIVAKMTLMPELRFDTVQILDLHYKVMKIGAGSVDDVVVSLSNGQVIYLDFRNNIFNVNTTSFTLEKKYATCWIFWKSGNGDKKMICGDKDGFVTLFTAEDQDLLMERVVDGSIRKRVGGNCGIITMVRDVNSGTVYVGNKNGEVYSVDDDLHVEIVLKNPCLMGWISRLDIDDEGQLVVLGFKSVWFRKVVLRGDEHSMVLEHPCGGGHRAWDYECEGARGTLAYVHSGAVRLCQWRDLCKDPLVVKPHLHGKEINCCQILKQVDGRVVVVNGAEDRTLSTIIFSNDDRNEPESVQKFHLHISSVRCVTEIDGGLLVSGGGRAQMVVWQRTGQAGSTLRAASSVFLQRLLANHTDPRIMDICAVLNNEYNLRSHLAVVCSSGSMSILSCAKPEMRLRLDAHKKVSSSCLTSVCLVTSSLLVTCATDGHVYWMPVSLTPVCLGAVSSHYVSKCSLHAMSSVSCDDGSVLVSLGGDDGGVRVLVLRQDEGDTWSVAAMSQYELGHAGSTVCTVLLHSALLATLGSDERLLLWRVHRDGAKGGRISIELMRSVSEAVGVTDPHSMVVRCLGDTGYCFYVVGMGARTILCALD